MPQANVKGRCNQEDSQGNRNASQAMPNPVAVDDSSRNEIEVSMGNETENLETDTMAGPEADAMG